MMFLKYSFKPLYFKCSWQQNYSFINHQYYGKLWKFYYLLVLSTCKIRNISIEEKLTDVFIILPVMKENILIEYAITSLHK